MKKIKKSGLLASFGSFADPKDLDDQLMNTPIRFLVVTGLPTCFLAGYVDLLNHRGIRGLHRILKGLRIMKKAKKK